MYHYDNIGSTTLLTNLTGTIIERFAYGTYGELLQKAKNAVRFLYNGSYGVVTDENGLYYMRARYYNPDIKRFLNQDIKVGDISNGQGLNRYAYCEGNPVSMVDPFGLSPQISQDQTSRFSVLHNILDLAGLAFDAADVINAAFYAAEGDWTNAALCAVAVIPIAGSAIAGAAKGTKAVVKAKKAEKILELAEESCKMTRNASDRLDVFSDVMKVSSKWGNSPVKLMDGIKAETGSRAIKALETGGDFGRESKRAVQELKAVAGAEGIHLKPSVSRKVDVFKDSFVTTEKKVKSGSSSGKYQVGAYQDIKGVEGLDAHHVGQKALMKKLVADYDELTAPAINVPKLGHTKRHPERGIVSRSTKGITNARQLLARDLFELKRVYPDIPNSALKELIDMNKKMYPEMRK
ncbi:MAG TPA: hypothetical protein DHV96_10160 [Lachnospiraceae bacterium]|nr:hypothetical protein [Lachnospiraceae bacterium]